MPYLVCLATEISRVVFHHIQRQIIFNSPDIKKNKSIVAAKKLKKINPNIKIIYYKNRLKKNNINKIAKKFDLIADGSDNFKTRFLINDYCLKNKKILIAGAINKFDGHIYTFNFLQKNTKAKAFLDCFINEPYKGNLLKLNNCYMTPHIATFTTETRNKMELACSKKLINFLRK